MTQQVRVPDAIAIVGYDDIDYCADTLVPLSSGAQPAREIGATGVSMIEAELGEGAGHVHRQVLLEPVLVPRASSR